MWDFKKLYYKETRQTTFHTAGGRNRDRAHAFVQLLPTAAIRMVCSLCTNVILKRKPQKEYIIYVHVAAGVQL